MAKVINGKIEDLFENINGGNAQLVYLQNDDPFALAMQFNEIKAGKQIIGAYSIGRKHVLAVYLESKVKIKRNKK